jgi:hypothetical protein
VIGRLGGAVLLLLGAASGWFALSEQYTVLMNPAFRWVTLAGAVLLLAMGAIQLGSARGGSPSALAVFGILFALVALAQPQAGGVTPALVAPDDLPVIERAGYTALEASALFETIDTEAGSVAPGQVAMLGFVKRLPALDATGEFVLLQPQMACCLADVLALGLRVKSTPGALPKDGAWLHVFGELKLLDPPVRTPSFRIGALLFIGVSRIHRLEAHEVATRESLLPPLYDKVPAASCSRFRTQVDAAGLAETLRGDGPLTVFAPLDVAYERLGAREPTPVGALIVRGHYAKQDLYGVDMLTTLRGTSLRVRAENGVLTIGGARVVFGDQQGRNGMLHLVHAVPFDEPKGR